MSASAKLKITTFHMQSGEVIKSAVKRNSKETRDWIVATISWAINNGHGVQVCNLKDDDGQAIS